MSISARVNGALDGETLTAEPHCPRCGYNLRGLPQPRCPECGLEFTWDGVATEAERRAMSRLFDHQWRQRPVRSFFLTLWRAVLPWRLWTPAALTLEPRVGPLLVLVLILGSFGIAWRMLLGYASETLCHYTYRGSWSWSAGLFRLTFDPRAWDWRELGHVLTALLVIAAVQVFRPTLKRHHVRLSHIVRVVGLSWITLVLWGLAVDTAETGINVLVMRFQPWPVSWLWCALFVPLLPYVLFAIGVGTGFATYLRVRRGGLLGLTGVTLSLLLVMVSIPVSTACLGTAANPWRLIALRTWPHVVDATTVLLRLAGAERF